MFIEGITKEKNPMIRSECASGLGRIGPSTFRTLLVALHDESTMVRDSVCAAILKNMTPEAVEEEFKDKSYQCQTIACSIREIFTN